MVRAGRFDRWPTLEGVHVLVVDHDRDERDLIEVVLQTCQAHVTAANALTSVRGTGPDVLIVDVDSPFPPALEPITRAAHVSRSAHSPAAIALSAVAPRERRAHVAAGFKAYVTRPIDLDALVRTVAALTTRRAILRAA